MFVVGAEGDNRLHAFNGETGEPLAAPPETMSGLRHLQTLIVAEDRVYVAGDGAVAAFAW